MTISLPRITRRTTTTLQQARAARTARRHLRAELESYRTPSERAELAAILGRHTEQELDLLAAATGRSYVP